MPVENVEYQGPEVGVTYGAKYHNLRTGARRGGGDFPRNNCPLPTADDSIESTTRRPRSAVGMGESPEKGLPV
jgi:hypothetical protein